MQSGEQKNTRRRWVVIIGLVLAVVFLYLAFRGVNWNEMVTIVQQANPAYLGVAVMIYVVSCFTRGARWRVLLTAEKKIPTLTVFWSLMIGYLANNFLPARAGEVIRAVVVGQHGGVSKSFSLATALTERIVDAVILVVVSVVSLLLMQTVVPPDLLPALRVMAIAAGIGGLGVLVAPHMGGVIFNIISRLPLPEGLKAKISAMMENFLLGTGSLQNWGRMGGFMLLSAVIWGLDAVTMMQLGNAFQMDLSAPLALVLLAALGLSSALPSTPGYVGVYQFVAVAVLTPFGFLKPQVLVFIIAFQLMAYIMIGLMGLLGLWQLNKSLVLPVDAAREPVE